MKLLTPIAAIVSLAAAGQIYNHAPAAAYQHIDFQPAQHQGFGGHQGLEGGFQGHQAIQGLGHGHQELNQDLQGQHYQDIQGHQDLQGYQGHQGHQGIQGHHDLQGYQGQGHQVSREATAKILSYQHESDGKNYQYAYETDNGIKAQEAGAAHGHGTQAQGAYSYTGDDGQIYTVTYTADENGFHAQGSHLPTPPPVPEDIAKSIEQNARDEASGVFDDGHYQQQQQQEPQHQVQQDYQQQQQHQVQQAYQQFDYQHQGASDYIGPAPVAEHKY